VESQRCGAHKALGGVDNLMIELARTVRFSVGVNRGSASITNAKSNTFAGWPSMNAMGAHYELDVVCRGTPDPVTGYMLNISEIDSAVRKRALTIFEAAFRNERGAAPALVLQDVLSALAPELRGMVHSVRWQLTPYHSIAMHADRPHRVLMSQQFEFSAAHRLNVPSMTAEENRAVFGKCNNDNGHGHNYRIEVVAAVELDGHLHFDLETFESIVNQTIIQRFDHKHLNLDTSEFAKLNPSVENIAKVCHDLLRTAFEASGIELHCVSVWETEKTRCTYPAR
jgi:6-pyruvoyltetrahydropterin/6-carboxytetrahydropterin synthase